ncbi:MAG TPA: putative Ig domain-containing protein [Burkholderiales bacterium]
MVLAALTACGRVLAAPLVWDPTNPRPPTTVDEGVAYRYTMRAVDIGVIGGSQPITYAAPVLPGWLAFDGVATISGTPGREHVGAHAVVLTATDGVMIIEDRFEILVARVNAAPVLQRPIAPDPQRAVAGQPYRLDAGRFFRDPDGDALSFTATGLPASLSIDSSTGEIAGTLADADADASPFNVTVQASDGEAAAADSFMLEVTRPDHPPTLTRRIEPDPQTAVEGQPYELVVAPFFSDPDGDVLTFRASNLPPSFAIDAATGRIAGTPTNADIAAKPVTTYSVTVTASNGGGEASDSFELRVRNVNEPPTLPDPPPRLTTDEDEPLTITAAALRAHDPDGDDLEVVLSPPGAGDHYTLAGGGTRVVPEADYSGPLSVRARVRDAEAQSNAVTVAIDVRPVNDRPRGGPVPPQSATEAVPFELALAPLFSDVEGDPLTFSARGLPPGLALDPATGVLAGTPPLGTEPRDYRVDLRVSDGEDRLDTRFTIALLRAGRADLAAAIDVTPNPVQLGTTATWTLTVRNGSTAEVGNVELTAEFTALAPFVFDPVATPGCALTPHADGAALTCRLGPVGAGRDAAVTVTGNGSRGGDVLGTLAVKVADAVPIDETPANDSAFASLHVAEALAGPPAQTLALADSRGAAAGDLDGDGAPDLVVASASGVAVFRGGPDPADAGKRRLADVPTMLAPSPANAVAAADVDGDGDLDLVTATPAGAPNALLLNGGGLAFTAVPLGGSNRDARAVALADLDGDALPEAVFATDGPASVYYNRGAGTFALGAELPANGSRDVALADLVGDPLPEVVLANAAADAAVHQRAGNGFRRAATLPTGPTAAVAVGDFDGNGVADLVFARDGADGGVPPSLANPVFLNTSAGTASFFLADALGAAATLDVLAADIDLDGDDDVLAVNATGGHQLYVNGGAATAAFLLHSTQIAAAGARAAVAGKIGIDDRIDVVLAGSDGAVVLFNDGQGRLGAGDVEGPVVTLLGEPTVVVTVGEPYVDAGATATDTVDGDVTARLVTENPVDTAVVGTYTVTYRATDLSGNASAPVTRSVEVRARSDAGGGGGGAIGLGALWMLWLLRLLRAVAGQRGRRKLI